MPASPQWNALGRSAGRWRDLCNWLLTPNPAGRPEDLGQVVEALRGLAAESEIAVLLVEQNLGVAVDVADRVGVMVNGRIARVGLQDSCHLRNGLGGHHAPRELLGTIGAYSGTVTFTLSTTTP